MQNQGKARQIHMDLGMLYTFLEEKGCGHIFPLYFRSRWEITIPKRTRVRNSGVYFRTTVLLFVSFHSKEFQSVAIGEKIKI